MSQRLRSVQLGLGLCSALLWPPTSLAAASEKMTNATVLELQQLKLGDEVIIEKIKSSECEFAVGIEALKTLKAAGVSSSVIVEMLRASRSASVPGKAARDPDDPLAWHEAGIYYFADSANGRKLVKLEPTAYAAVKSEGFLRSALSYGLAPTQSKVVVLGATAQARILNRQPTFYFHFGSSGSGLADSPFGYFRAATSASEFVLARMELKFADNTRELLVGQSSVAGVFSGIPPQSLHSFDFEQLGPGIYKVVPKSELEPGEYCFVRVGAAPAAYGAKLFDFGLR